MNEQALRVALNETGESDAAFGCARQEALNHLSPDITRTAARLRAWRSERRQMILFAALASIFALTAFLALSPRSGMTVMSVRVVLWAGGALMALTLILSPFVAYCLEEEREHG